MNILSTFALLAAVAGWSHDQGTALRTLRDQSRASLQTFELARDTAKPWSDKEKFRGPLATTADGFLAVSGVLVTPQSATEAELRELDKALKLLRDNCYSTVRDESRPWMPPKTHNLCSKASQHQRWLDELKRKALVARIQEETGRFASDDEFVLEATKESSDDHLAVVMLKSGYRNIYQALREKSAWARAIYRTFGLGRMRPESWFSTEVEISRDPDSGRVRVYDPGHVTVEFDENKPRSAVVLLHGGARESNTEIRETLKREAAPVLHAGLEVKFDKSQLKIIYGFDPDGSMYMDQGKAAITYDRKQNRFKPEGDWARSMLLLAGDQPQGDPWHPNKVVKREDSGPKMSAGSGPPFGTKTTRWSIAIMSSNSAGSMGSVAAAVGLLKNRDTGETRLGGLVTVGMGVGASIAGHNLVAGLTDFSTKKEVGFQDFHKTPCRFTTIGVHIGVAGYSQTYLTFTDLLPKDESINLSGFEVLSVGASAGATVGVWTVDGM